ncbi:glycosyltransferase [Sphingobacterium oryzagri]|uniref:Glycosyltransferase n=1 Tax=Sphingobacterium oryzagri TaxID=3025669 RepID=A0ABY7WK34_9SPHI|nr:glycosyltransferase [Sphingobacterium sp. KACC 22765]WDF68964.1 glycosyltransferase [Sphingobacterium sp. KACC 22765]
MISIIISSYNDDLFEQVCDSIETTIGSVYEIVKISNKGKFGITTAYNLGVQRAKFDILVFCHEDVLFHTANWGLKLIEKFSINKKLGLAGFAGSRYKPFNISGWFIDDPDILVYNMFESNYKQPTVDKRLINNITEDTFVSCIDGFFMASTKSVMNGCLFDEKLLEGYHGYDLDISLCIGQRFDIMVIGDISIEHRSYGKIDGNWVTDIIKVNQKWQASLPRATRPFEDKERYEYLALSTMLTESRGDFKSFRKLGKFVFSAYQFQNIGVKYLSRLVAKYFMIASKLFFR